MTSYASADFDNDTPGPYRGPLTSAEEETLRALIFKAFPSHYHLGPRASLLRTVGNMSRGYRQAPLSAGLALKLAGSQRVVFPPIRDADRAPMYGGRDEDGM